MVHANGPDPSLSLGIYWCTVSGMRRRLWSGVGGWERCHDPGVPVAPLVVQIMGGKAGGKCRRRLRDQLESKRERKGGGEKKN